MAMYAIQRRIQAPHFINKFYIMNNLLDLINKILYNIYNKGSDKNGQSCAKRR